MPHPSFRTRLRAFQAMRGDPPDPGFVADLEFLENRDLDLSIRLGAMLAFNALLITIGTHPVSASPGARALWQPEPARSYPARPPAKPLRPR